MNEERPASDKVCDCGHMPTWPRSQSTTGYGVSKIDGVEHTECFDCCNQGERRQMAERDRYFAYLVEAPCGPDEPARRLKSLGHSLAFVVWKIQTWPGGELGVVTRANAARVNAFGGSVVRWYLQVRAFDGSLWYGTSPGVGMFCRLRRCKTKITRSTRRLQKQLQELAK